ncbi:MAG TPA: DUF4340 domain-containing protein [Methylotenera sp.]|nr:DUF4340 domain-containing protein [Methylotenera sp.]
MKNRWILNFVMLALVAGLVAFLYLRPQASSDGPTQHEVTTLKLADFNAIKVEFPTQAPTTFEKVNGLWRMTAPYKTRADQLSVQRILSIIAAKTQDKFTAENIEKFGLDKPQLRLKLSGVAGTEEFIFGTFNTVTDEQYVAYKDSVYLLPGNYAEAASTQAIEMVDKNPLAPPEAKQIAGFDYAHLEQWEDIGLQVDIAEGTWKTNAPKAKITQNELNEWLDFSWKQAQAKQVELYTPDRKITYPSFKVKLKDGTKVHFDKIQESPDLLLARPDEGLLYHFANDVGFTMLNPPLNIE